MQRRVAYFYDDQIGSFYYGPGHPMKPHRIRMTHQLVMNYSLYKSMYIFRPFRATAEEMKAFHTDDYISFLSNLTVENKHDQPNGLKNYHVDVDCPVFDQMFDFCRIYAGGSLAGAYKLNRKDADICINWSGGLHHAKKANASGFCYVNDIVLAIQEMLRYYTRVLYVDIDVHHGDGVEEAFYTTDRVMTLSFHKYAPDFFPGTGGLEDNGKDAGRGYALNVPLDSGLTDENFQLVFRPVVDAVFEYYEPDAVVLQCGADSLAWDRLGPFELTLRGHGACVSHIKEKNVPLLLLGGGGYTTRNVARCWAYETSLVVGQELSDDIPFNEYYEYFGPDYRLHISRRPESVDMNKREKLESLVRTITEKLRSLPRASPGVEIKEAPQAPMLNAMEEETSRREDEENPDVRSSQATEDRLQVRADEFYSDEKDQDDDVTMGDAKPGVDV